MAHTLKFGSRPNRLSSRIDRMVIRRRTIAASTAADQAADDYARHVAAEVSPGQLRAPRSTRVGVLDDSAPTQRRLDFLAH